MRVIMTLVVVLAAQTSAFAAPDWQQRLISDGWVELKRKLTDFTDHTWYGQPNRYRSTEGFVYYLRPGGRNGVLRMPNGNTFIDHRREGKDGKICSLIRELRGGREYCGNRLWKRGKLYLFTNPAGRVIHVWKWKKGNLENFKQE